MVTSALKRNSENTYQCSLLDGVEKKFLKLDLCWIDGLLWKRSTVPRFDRCRSMRTYSKKRIEGKIYFNSANVVCAQFLSERKAKCICKIKRWILISRCILNTFMRQRSKFKEKYIDDSVVSFMWKLLITLYVEFSKPKDGHKTVCRQSYAPIAIMSPEMMTVQFSW